MEAQAFSERLVNNLQRSYPPVGTGKGSKRVDMERPPVVAAEAKAPTTGVQHGTWTPGLEARAFAERILHASA